MKEFILTATVLSSANNPTIIAPNYRSSYVKCITETNSRAGLVQSSVVRLSRHTHSVGPPTAMLIRTVSRRQQCSFI